MSVSTFGGLAAPVFSVTSDLGRFGWSDAPEHLTLFGAALPPPQIPAFQEQRLPAPFVAEHHAHAGAAAVPALAVPGAVLRGNGVVTLGTQFVAPEDCLPGYVRAAMASVPHRIDPSQSAALDRDDLAELASDLPVASVLHTNPHYPRALLEIVPRLYVAAILRDYGVRFRLGLPANLPAWLGQFVTAFGLDSLVLRYDPQRQRVSAPSVILPGMLQRDYNLHPAFNLLAGALVAQAGAPPQDAPRFLYLRRSPFAGQRVENEAAVAEAMAQAGFHVVQTHALPLVERVRLLAGAEVVAGEYGPALLDVLFAPFGARVLAINFSDNPLSRIARLRRQPVAFVPPADGLFRHPRLTGGAPPGYVVDIAALLATVRAFVPELD